MAKMRIYQAAREYKISSEALVKILRELDYPVKSHMSIITDEMRESVDKKFASEKEELKKEIKDKQKKKRERERREREEKQAALKKPEVAPVAKSTVEEKPPPRKQALSRGPRFPFQPKRKKRRGRRRRGQPFDIKDVEASVKKTITALEASKRGRKHHRRDRQDGGGDEEDARVLKVVEFMSVAELAEAMGERPAALVAKCLELGMIATINQRLDMDTITTLALEFDYDVEEAKDVGFEEEEVDSEEDLEPRPCVVTIMGHVDHGKTSLLDHIRESNIVAGESGGITQHIGSYKVDTGRGQITFIDTPGHRAFTAMRARGVQLTDIVVLVVAADDSVMPQTLEAIDHARAAGVPIVVAINKIDLPGANVDRVKQELAEQQLVPEEWGGKTIMVEISAKFGTNIDKLLDMILLQAEVMELKANRKAPASGAVIESYMDRGKGPVVNCLIQRGTLQVGNPFVTGMYSGRVRAMFDERNRALTSVYPGDPVQILGCSGLPQAGDALKVVASEAEARELSLKRQRLRRERDYHQMKRITLSQVYEQMKEGQIEELNLIIKADVDGSAEALSDALGKIVHEEVRVRVIHRGVGLINESDILLAAASNANVIGFHTKPDARAQELAARENVDVRLYRIIYEVEEDIKKALEGMLAPEVTEVVIGTVEVRDVFKISRIGTIAGCYVRSGVVKRSAKARVLRQDEVMFVGEISSLKRFKEDVKEVASGFECGIGLEGFDDIAVGDIIQVFEEELTARHLDSDVTVGS